MKKKSKKKSSEAANVKQVPKKLNPFEIHINRKKYDVLGMKSKADRGLPGVSRSKAIKKRKATLLQEYKVKDKSNKFMDRRIGEKNRAMTSEDKLLARYAAERMKFHAKKSIYNLGDDEELTHRGQTLTEIEKFDDPRSDEEEDEDEDGKLDSEFVKEAHFGGGILRKVEGESKSRKDMIEQLIAESKKRKAEKQKIHEQTLDLTQKLDSEWKELLPIVTATKRAKTDIEPDPKKDEKSTSYDMLSKELKFETRGKPSDKLKSEEEAAKEEKGKLEKLEKERLERMYGLNDSSYKAPPKHRSADDLDDGFEIDDGTELFLKYGKEGNPDIKEANNGKATNDSSNEEEQNNDDSSNDDISEGEEDDSEVEEDDKEEVREEEENVDEPKEGDESDESVDLSDLKEPEQSDIEEEKTPDQTPENKEKVQPQGKTTYSIDDDDGKNVVQKSDEIEKAANNLPFTFEVPEKYEEFEGIMNGHKADVQSIIIERMIKSNHPSLKDDHKVKLDTLFTYMLQHLQDISSEEDTQCECFKVLDKLAPWLYDLAQWSPESSASAVVEVIREKYQHFSKRKKTYPSLDTFIFLELVSILFPTSDYRHKVVTPCLIFMEHMLASCKIQSSTDVSAGLFLSTLILEYCSFSKRYVPEAINFVRGVLRMAFPKKSEVPTIPPFSLKNLDTFALQVVDTSRSYKLTKMRVNDLLEKTDDDDFKIKAVSLALHLLTRFCDLWGTNAAALLIFEPFVPLLRADNYCECLRGGAQEALEKVMSFKKEKLEKLMLESKKPKPLRLYEPRIEEVYSFKKHRPMSREKQEREKLVYKYKKEMKGALREIRRDRSFISKLKFKQTQKSDAERQQKVRDILGSAAQQAGELRKLKRQK